MTRPVVPWSPEAERNVIGSALIWPESAEVLATEIEPSDFYDVFHADVARAIRARVLKGERINESIIATDLEAIEPDRDDHRRRLTALSVVAGSVIRPSVEEIWDCAARRRILLATQDLTAAAVDRSVPMDDVLDLARKVAEVAEVPTTHTEADPDLDSFLDLSDDEYNWLVPGLLERGDRLMVTGEEGRGKARSSDRSHSASRQGWGRSEWVPRSRCA